MKSIELNIEKALGTVSKSDVFALEDKAKKRHGNAAQRYG